MNPYSILHDYDQEKYTPDFGFIQTGLAYKQGKYNQNKQLIESKLNEYKMLQVYRDVDKEYVGERLDSILKIADQHLSGDLSSDAYTDSITRHLGQLMDPTVKNAVSSTKIFEAENTRWDDLKEKSPEKYSDLNRSYALRASEAWRNGQVAGERYNGGGDVIEFTDVNKTFTEAIPKMQEMLKAEWVQDGPGNGYFRSLSTYEAVPRQSMEQALDTLIGQKERNQLRINAWGTYSQVDDANLREDYNNYFSPQLENSQSKVDQYNKMISSETDETKKQDLINVRDREQKIVDDLNSNSYDDVVGSYGKEAAYSTLYMSKFKDGYLNAYSYEPREIKREVNQLDVETRNLETKLRDQNLAERKFELDVSNSEFDKEKFFIEQSTKQSTTGSANTPLIGPSSVLGPEQGYSPEADSHIKAQQALETQATKDMKSVLGSQFGNLNGSQLKQLGGQLKNIAGKNSITVTIDGETKKIDLTDDKNLQAVIDFKDYVLNDSPSKKFEQESVYKIVKKLKQDLTTVAQGENRDIDLSQLPNYGLKLVPGDKDQSGKVINYRVEKNDYSGGSYYGHLLRKDNRTDAENLTLDLYTSLHLMADPTLSQEQKKSVFSTIQSKIYNKVDSESVAQLPKNWYAAYGSTNAHGVQKQTLLKDIDSGKAYKESLPGQLRGEYELSDLVLSQAKRLGFENEIKKYAELNKSLGTASKSEALDIRKQMSAIKSQVNSGATIDPNNYNPKTYGKLGSDYYLSDFTSGDLEWSGGGLKQGFDTYIKKSFENVYTKLESDLGNQNMNMNLRAQIFTPSQGKSYQDLAYSLGLPKDSKIPITLTRRLGEDGKPTGQVDFSYSAGTPSAPVTVNSADGELTPLDPSRLASLGIQYGDSDRPRYRASYGENAPKIELGTSKVSRDVEENSRKINPSLPLDNAEMYIDEAAKYGVQGQIAGALSNFYNGAYTFKLMPDDGVWRAVITNNGKEVYSESTNESDYSTEEVKDMYKNSYYYNQVVFNNYLVELKDKAIRDAKIAASRQQ